MTKPTEKHRIKKTVWLSPAAIEYVGQYAQLHGKSFSRSIEDLALMSLSDGHVMSLLNQIRDVVSNEATRHYNRFAKLVVFAGLEAGAAKNAAQAAVFLQMVQMAGEVKQPEAMANALSVDPETPMGKEIIRLFKKREGGYRYKAVKALKKPIAELWEILEELEEHEAGLSTKNDASQSETN